MRLCGRTFDDARDNAPFRLTNLLSLADDGHHLF